MKRLHHGLTGALCLVLCAVAHAQTPVDFYQTWSGTGLKGWTNTDASTTLSNPGGYLGVAFGSQQYPQIQSGIAYTNIIPGIIPTNVAFAIKPFEHVPSALRIYVHSVAHNRNWYYSLESPATNVWTTMDVPLSYNAGWICDPGLSQADFQSDMLSVDWIGVYIGRNGAVEPQNYGLDDFLVQGVIAPSGLSIFGTIGYEGDQSGTIYVSAASESTTAMTTLASPGEYTITNVAIGASYTIAGYRDSNGNTTQEFWEANGEWSGNPAELFVDDLTGVDIAMTDPTSAEGLPYWWLNEHFGITEPGGSGGEAQSQADADDDRFATGDEYWAGTDPTNPLSFFMVDMTYTNNAGTPAMVLTWDSIPDRTYGVWRSASVGGGFTKIEAALATTPPQNTYQDLTATGRGPYFYRVEVER